MLSLTRGKRFPAAGKCFWPFDPPRERFPKLVSAGRFTFPCLLPAGLADSARVSHFPTRLSPPLQRSAWSVASVSQTAALLAALAVHVHVHARPPPTHRLLLPPPSFESTHHLSISPPSAPGLTPHSHSTVPHAFSDTLTVEFCLLLSTLLQPSAILPGIWSLWYIVHLPLHQPSPPGPMSTQPHHSNGLTSRMFFFLSFVHTHCSLFLLRRWFSP